METKAAIVHYCKYQERCHSEVRNKLYELGCNTRLVDELLAAVIEMGLVNEERFARSFARGKFRLKKWGREKIKAQLRLKKVSDYCIRKGLSEIDEQDYAALLQHLAEKKYAEVRSDRSIPSRKAKMFRFLAQRGFERDMIIDTINNVIGK
jgi:regulatory protein